ncbi:MAG: putative DNA binding domain-containing protein [Anaerolineales bacterium]|nr:putative DNA binding domain-containing protein [Anaerolineales bacterium]
MDLHIHTPGSLDYQEQSASYLDILRKAELRSLDIIAFTDHNTLRGYAAMMREIEQLEFLERLGRAEPEEIRRLAEYRRLLEKVLVLPGFEFTATFGFHILGIFSPRTPLRQIEHILMSLRINPTVMDEGNPAAGASSDVLTAYRLINEAGGIVLAAHANSTHGVAMRGFDFGGQTKIAYTQDPYLHALEVTDLEKKGWQTTSRFFDGSKPEYPRKMRCIQGSDAHRLSADARNPKNLGIGDRVTEVSLPERSFEALIDMFRGTDFARTRPYRSSRDPYDYIQAAREEGANIVQSFHEDMTRRNGFLYNIVADVCAMANTNGGAIYVGLEESPKKKPIGVENVQASIEALYAEIDSKITPKLDVEIDAQDSQGKTIIRIQVPRGNDVPYAVDESKIYVRDDSETSLAVRDEIVQMIARNLGQPQTYTFETPLEETPLPAEGVPAPLTGVEIIATEERKGRMYHTVRDLRNGSTVRNVTRSSARRLWHYAITEHESRALDPNAIQWHGEIGLIKVYERGNDTRYDLAQYDEQNNVRIYYGVTEEGLHGPWQVFTVQQPST